MEGQELDARLERLNAQLQEIRLRYQEVLKEAEVLKQSELVVMGQIKEREKDIPVEPELPDFDDPEKIQEELDNIGTDILGRNEEELLESRQELAENDSEAVAEYIDGIQKEEE